MNPNPNFPQAPTNPSSSALIAQLNAFIEYTHLLKGDEKGEAQVFCDRLFQAFGHKGYKEAGATLEERISGGSRGKNTGYADLVWPGKLLLEMKKRGSKLANHYDQAFQYWVKLVPNRPNYVVLCNFDEFWIYDFNTQVDAPIDTVTLPDIERRYTAFNFLLPVKREPVFKNNRVAVTKAAADKVVRVFKEIQEGRGQKGQRPISREDAQRFTLQCVVAMFSEDAGLLPRGLFSEMLIDARKGDDAARYDLFQGLFRQMNDPNPAQGGRFQDVRYFNGGLFDTISIPRFTTSDIGLLQQAAEEDWSRVQPAIFGTLFQQSMDKGERHVYGAHFTSEADVQKIVQPTIARPWTERIDAAASFDQLLALHGAMLKYQVLDPACGGGNFLYVAYRELKRLETLLLERLVEANPTRAQKALAGAHMVSTRQFHGIDNNGMSVELAKVTLMIAKELTVAETQERIASGQVHLPLDFDKALPLDNLDKQIRRDDALFCTWPRANAIIGNPPYQSKNKMQREFGAAYVNRVREKYAGVPGRADYCVYWFRRAHDELASQGRAGLVGTNTIRQNYSREGGLDYIVGNGGTITEAVATQVWSGEAAVHVSIVNWIKGEADGPKQLFTQLGDNANSPFDCRELSFIHSALSPETDVTQARVLQTNAASQACYQGQTHGHKGFLLTRDEAEPLLRDKKNREVIFPYFIADELLGAKPPLPHRYVIDLNHYDDIFAAQKHAAVFKILQTRVLPTMQANADEEKKTTGQDNGPRQNHLKTWWKHWRGREEMLGRINSIPRYIACGRVTKRPIFEFVDSGIHPNDALMVFPLADDYSFGILSSALHWEWFKARCSTLKSDWRYTSNFIFDSFGWPQAPTLGQARGVAQAAHDLRQLRRELMQQNDFSLRELYRTLELPGANRLRSAQQTLDAAVRAAYGMKPDDEPLSFLLELNATLAAHEAANQPITGPGLPPGFANAPELVSDDCVAMPR